MHVCWICLNIECGQSTVSELEGSFRYNDAVIRNMVLRVNRAITEPSPIYKEKEGRGEAEARHRRQLLRERPLAALTRVRPPGSDPGSEREVNG